MAGQSLRAAAALSLGAALIHGSVIASHFREYWLFGVFFVAVAVLQLAWGLAVWAGRGGRDLLVAGAIGNLAVALIWLISRTAGLPLGPDAGEREALDLHDVLATASELALTGLVAWSLHTRRAAPNWALAGAWALAATGALAAFVAPYGHG